MNRLGLLAVSTVLVFVAACSEGGPVVPALPELELSNLPPAVSGQLLEARERAANAPSDAAASADLGSMLHAYSYLSEAADCYRRATVLDPLSPEWAYFLGDVLQRMGHTDDALSALRQALRLDPGDNEVSLKLAAVLEGAGEASVAVDLYRQILRRDPENPHALYGLGRLALTEGRATEAVDYLRRALDATDDFGAAHYAISQAYRALGNDEKARKHLDLFAMHEHNRITPYTRLRQRLVTRVESDRGQVVHGIRMITAGRVDESIAAFEAALRINPDNANTHTTLVGLYGAQGDLVAAQRHFDAAVAIDPSLPKTYYNMGAVLLDAGRIDEAVSHLERAVEIEPRDAALRTAFAQALERGADVEAAIAQYRLALDTEPAYGRARQLLIQALAAQGRYVDAIAAARAGISVENDWTVSLLREVAGVHAEAGDIDAALGALDRAREVARARGELGALAGVNSDMYRYRALKEGEGP